MKKKIVSVILVAAMAVGCLAGCGSKEAKNEDAFYIGGIGPVTGDAAIYGTAVQNGAQIAVDEINEAGGINGHQIEYNFQDDQGDPEKAANAYNTLKDWGMQVLMGTVTTGPCVSVADLTAADNMFQITPSASSTDVIKNDNVFQVCFTDPAQGTKSAQYIGENNLAKKVAIIYNSSDIYSSGIEAKFVEEAANQNFEVVAEEAFTADSKTDFSSYLETKFAVFSSFESAANGVNNISPSAKEVSKFLTPKIPSIPSHPKNVGAYPIESAWVKIIDASV